MRLTISAKTLITFAALSFIGACAATAPNATSNGYPAATLHPGAKPACRADEEIANCAQDGGLSALRAHGAFPDGGFREAVIEQKKEARRDRKRN